MQNEKVKMFLSREYDCPTLKRGQQAVRKLKMRIFVILILSVVEGEESALYLGILRECEGSHVRFRILRCPSGRPETGRILWLRLRMTSFRTACRGDLCWG